MQSLDKRDYTDLISFGGEKGVGGWVVPGTMITFRKNRPFYMKERLMRVTLF